MTFEGTLADRRRVLVEGAVIERLRRDPAVALDPLLLNTGCLFDARGREVLAGIYHEYLRIGFEHDLPMIVCSPTWRANPDRIRRAGAGSCAEVNGEAVRFVAGVRADHGAYASKVFLAGILGCRGDAYDPSEGLPEGEAESFHAEQARALAAAGADFLLAVTLPAVDEARGMARAMSRCGVPYVVSFIVREEGVLLDGTPLAEAVTAIDAVTDPAPACYWVNCVHPSVFDVAMGTQLGRSGSLRERLIGLQANTSALAPDQLDGSETLCGEDASTFGASMARLYETHGTRILGGCCGTDATHIRAIAERISGG